jgi:hypothetical protein
VATRTETNAARNATAPTFFNIHALLLGRPQL